MNDKSLSEDHKSSMIVVYPGWQDDPRNSVRIIREICFPALLSRLALNHTIRRNRPVNLHNLLNMYSSIRYHQTTLISNFPPRPIWMEATQNSSLPTTIASLPT